MIRCAAATAEENLDQATDPLDRQDTYSFAFRQRRHIHRPTALQSQDNMTIDNAIENQLLNFLIRKYGNPSADILDHLQITWLSYKTESYQISYHLPSSKTRIADPKTLMRQLPCFRRHCKMESDSFLAKPVLCKNLLFWINRCEQIVIETLPDSISNRFFQGLEMLSGIAGLRMISMKHRHERGQIGRLRRWCWVPNVHDHI